MERNLGDRKQLVNGDRFAVDVRGDLGVGANSSNAAVVVEVEVDLAREGHWHGHNGRHSKGDIGVNDGCAIASEVFVLPSNRGKHLTCRNAEVNHAVAGYADRYRAAAIGIAILEGVSDAAIDNRGRQRGSHLQHSNAGAVEVRNPKWNRLESLCNCHDSGLGVGKRNHLGVFYTLRSGAASRSSGSGSTCEREEGNERR